MQEHEKKILDVLNKDWKKPLQPSTIAKLTGVKNSRLLTKVLKAWSQIGWLEKCIDRADNGLGFTYYKPTVNGRINWYKAVKHG